MKSSNQFYRRKFVLFLFDFLAFAITYAVCALMAQDISSSVRIAPVLYLRNGGVLYGCVLVMRLLVKTYSNVWRYASYGGYLKLILADAFGGGIGLVITRVISEDFGYIGVWQTASVLALQLLVCIGGRLSYQYLRGIWKRAEQTGYHYVAIVGAGSVGTALAEELTGNNASPYRPRFYVDNDPQKVGSIINELRVLNAADPDLMRILHQNSVEEVIIAFSTPDPEKTEEVYKKYHAAGFGVRIYDFAADSRTAPDQNQNRKLREVQVEDLLFRKQIEIPRSGVELYQGKTVLVTGGGGSIGSEICRQIAKLAPKQLVIFDIYENNAYDIQQELTIAYGGALHLCVEIGSVRDRQRLDAVFAKYRPDVVFHAAAHKHVPLMEHSAAETVKNNVLGTYNTADMAEKYGTRKFVLISTDKAVNPTNVMGASKRMCEMVVQCRTDSETSFAAVRFGNVLGSNGSVIPLFKRQIAAGGPVTITDKRIIRYFMTIPEASRLVLTAGALSRSGELFVLDMGKPVRILDLAENMIRLSGYEPYKDIAIEEIGLRPGEKLYEELLIKSEVLTKTDNSLIFIERDTPLTRGEVEEKIRILQDAIRDADVDSADRIRAAYCRVVPTFVDPETVNGDAENAAEMKQARDTAQSDGETEEAIALT